MKINAKTKVFGVIGDPIEHSLSPAMHNAVFEELGLNCLYTAFRIKPEDLKDAINGFKAQGFSGVNVTIPHKVSCIEFLDGLSKEARVIGAVNTIEIKDKAMIGHNTDGIGALRALIDGGANPEGKKILIIGSGGAARAIAVTLALRGNVKSLTILGIVEDELKDLIKDILKETKSNVSGKIMTDEIKEREIKRADILMQCTPVGMYPKVDETLVTADMIPKNLKIMDIVYTPMETRLMKEAKKAGCKTVIGGLDMFVNQGAEALKIWLGIKAPLKLMKEIVAGELEKQH